MSIKLYDKEQQISNKTVSKNFEVEGGRQGGRSQFKPELPHSIECLHNVNEWILLDKANIS